ncbi:hypothetical protein J2T03_001639 [Chryseobacterium lathyri]|nr:hypothetical protein [Chryseobacterium lathyri]
MSTGKASFVILMLIVGLSTSREHIADIVESGQGSI